MKIAMIGQKGVPATYGGIERNVEEVGSRLAKMGHEVTVYCRLYYTKRGGSYHGMRLIRLPSINTKHLDTATHCLVATWDSLLRDYDIVQFHALGPSVFARIPRLSGARTVVMVHGLDWQREKWGPTASWILKKCEYPAVHFPDRTVVVSNTLQRYFLEKFHRETVVIPNGTKAPVNRPPSQIRKYGLEHGNYVLFVGRLVPEKGVHFLTEAFSKIDTDLKLVLAGGSSFSDSYVSQLRSHEGNRVIFLDYVYGDVLEELWSNAYMVVQPSTMEGLSISLLEALSYGRCVLVSDIPENVEVVGDCSPSFRTQDVGDLTKKLGALLGSRELVQDYERKCRDHVSRKFSWDTIAEGIEKLYLEVLEAGGKS
jgi:glycosyltransferase involved in cell wall biosynthesis